MKSLLLGIICDALRDLVLFVQFRNVKNSHDGVLPLVTLFHGCFSRFLNCTNGTKSGKTYIGQRH